ncbi:conserved hypothetical protein [Xenorhabdus nematophila F1]|uniref:Uncharacterized protein n=1 Tax=Xenorhabdus nematophila (strain ATCC 19061 / DSM 3370 / CCUG 14189 / LMG 1036 / NCIMB 9965 / AN6) TaxID=406817 RepID=D3VKX0_XENNA|nr:hypothetical protein D3790_04245 [Xenorhabdus nematophila]CBJ91228.1 hypothetical protein XNC1_3176 [Xenorhabdus nematophila ATCC 19061]CCW29628.1 conserved hypothetical protein [Xenorhabdus nematophila F1]CEE94119.1 hypothetical protein XNA1_4500022 [Xenorhabdus nematophila str. Anatoliense]CEF28548.1 hypothetical protein XNW1_1150023 [Xenorhabdus nematophila str. Websteri]CEK24049.1 hypothetical protein XNC2_3055 [Xenorhabdus nematophila AN6/1]
MHNVVLQQTRTQFHFAIFGVMSQSFAENAHYNFAAEISTAGNWIASDFCVNRIENIVFLGKQIKIKLKLFNI